jgi:hypothetical protein
MKYSMRYTDLKTPIKEFRTFCDSLFQRNVHEELNERLKFAV